MNRPLSRRRLIKGSVALVGAFGVALFTTRLPARFAQSLASAGVVSVQIEISHRGFNGAPSFLLEVEEGQQVELTFLWADNSLPDNAHRMLLEEYELETGLLTSGTPLRAMSFVADKTGLFDLECNWQCEGHDNLKGGRVRVWPAGTAFTPNLPSTGSGGLAAER